MKRDTRSPIIHHYFIKRFNAHFHDGSIPKIIKKIKSFFEKVWFEN